MTGCPECQAAAAAPPGAPHCIYRWTCRGCRARHVAGTLLFHELATARRQTRVHKDAYRELLERCNVTHDDVLAARSATLRAENLAAAQ